MTASIPPSVEELIAGRTLMANLATCADGRPHVAPVWYDYADGTLRILTGGRKLANIRENPRAAVSIESHDEEGNAEWMVAMQGTARIVEDAERVREAARAIHRTYAGDASAGDDAEGPLVVVEVANAVSQRY